MNITIIGASRGVGKITVKRALERGHTVTALSRSGTKLCDPNLKDVQGNALNLKAVRKAIHAADAVIVTLGTGIDIRKTFLFSDFAHVLMEIHWENPFRIPVIILTGFGTDDTLRYHPWYTKLLLKVFLGRVYKDKSRMEQLISRSAIQWEFVRPWIMSNGKLTEEYRIELANVKAKSFFSFISRYDVADFMVKQVEKPDYLLQAPALFHK